MLLIMGVVSYYIAPMSFLYNDIRLFLFILNSILMLMMLGFTLLINLLQPVFEKLFLSAMLNLFALLKIYKDKALHFIILKNMLSHCKRNNQTTLIFSIALAFVIYNGTGFALQSLVLADTLKYQTGSDISLSIKDDNGLPESQLRVFLETYRK